MSLWAARMRLDIASRRSVSVVVGAPRIAPFRPSESEWNTSSNAQRTSAPTVALRGDASDGSISTHDNAGWRLP